jgi:hypothetical protein
MANRRRENERAGTSTQPKYLSETQSSPQTERRAASPLEKDDRAATRESVAQSFSTDALDDPSTDSMFNMADPQTKKLLERKSAGERGPKQKP